MSRSDYRKGSDVQTLRATDGGSLRSVRVKAGTFAYANGVRYNIRPASEDAEVEITTDDGRTRTVTAVQVKADYADVIRAAFVKAADGDESKGKALFLAAVRKGTLVIPERPTVTRKGGGKSRAADDEIEW